MSGTHWALILLVSFSSLIHSFREHSPSTVIVSRRARHAKVVAISIWMRGRWLYYTVSLAGNATMISSARRLWCHRIRDEYLEEKRRQGRSGEVAVDRRCGRMRECREERIRDADVAKSQQSFWICNSLITKDTGIFCANNFSFLLETTATESGENILKMDYYHFLPINFSFGIWWSLRSEIFHPQLSAPCSLFKIKQMISNVSIFHEFRDSFFSDEGISSEYCTNRGKKASAELVIQSEVHLIISKGRRRKMEVETWK